MWYGAEGCEVYEDGNHSCTGEHRVREGDGIRRTTHVCACGSEWHRREVSK